MIEYLPFIILSALLAVTILPIVFTLISLAKLGDERSNYIKLKAQSSAFNVVVGLVFLNVIESIYVTFKTSNSYTGTHPIIFLTVISLVYLVALLFAKRKYGG